MCVYQNRYSNILFPIIAVDHDRHSNQEDEHNGIGNHEEDGEESVQLLCCSFQKYLHCSESVVNTTCGYETARFTKSFLDRMSGPLIQVKRDDSLQDIIYKCC